MLSGTQQHHKALEIFEEVVNNIRTLPMPDTQGNV